MKKYITLLIMTFILTSISAQSKKANLYPFNESIINLDLLEIDTTNQINEANNFKKSSINAHRFKTNRFGYYSDLNESLIIDNTTYTIIDGFYLKIKQNDSIIEKELAGVLINESKELIGFLTEKNKLYTLTMKNGKSYNFKLPNDGSCSLLLKDNLLYIANFHPISTGSSLYCFDLNLNTIIWEADVEQYLIPHSKYWNGVVISIYENIIIMEGKEAGVIYLQLFDSVTGERIANF